MKSHILYLFLILSAMALCYLPSCKKDPAPGHVTVYKTSALGLGTIRVYFDNGIEGNISDSEISYYTPDCGEGLINITTSEFKTHQFKAVAADGSEWSRSVNIAEGACERISLTLGNRTHVPPQQQTGQVVFWESSGNGCSSTTNVTINGVTKQISSFSASSPQCGSSGNATFTLSPGIYNYSASCSGTPKTGSVAVYQGLCTPVQLTWTPQQTTGQVMFWVKTDFGCGPITVNIGGTTRTISSYYGSIPSCGASGCANFTLSAGTYAFSASCNGYTWNSTVTITNGGCTKQELII